jgi:hypothetical protein
MDATHGAANDSAILFKVTPLIPSAAVLVESAKS